MTPETECKTMTSCDCRSLAFTEHSIEADRPENGEGTMSLPTFIILVWKLILSTGSRMIWEISFWAHLYGSFWTQLTVVG